MSDLHGTLICHSLQQNGWTALILASRHVECMRILLERGAQANTQDKVSSSRPVQCLLLMYVLVVYMWTVRVICEWNIVTVAAWQLGPAMV